MRRTGIKKNVRDKASKWAIFDTAATAWVLWFGFALGLLAGLSLSAGLLLYSAWH